MMTATPRRPFRAVLARIAGRVSRSLRREPEERVSVWSVARSQVVIFFPAMIAGWSIALAYFAFAEAAGHTATAESGLPERVEAVLKRFGPMVIPLAAASMIASAGVANSLLALAAIRRGIMKIADRIYQWAAGPIEAEGEARGIAQGEAQGEARGIALGDAQGEARGIARALEWAQRKAEAERNGVPFHEPAPEPAPPPQR